MGLTESDIKTNFFKKTILSKTEENRILHKKSISDLVGLTESDIRDNFFKEINSI